jgi:hypothetical protein
VRLVTNTSASVLQSVYYVQCGSSVSSILLTKNVRPILNLFFVYVLSEIKKIIIVTVKVAAPVLKTEINGRGDPLR